jgi:phosphate transport system substrate-binding protein
MPEDDRFDSATRRKFILGSGAASIAMAAGCTSLGGGGGGDGGDGGDGGSGATTPLTADGSSTVYPITSDGGSVWNSNPPADDKEYWGPGQYGIDTDKPMADYWAGLYGFEPRSAGPPFSVSVGLSHSGTGVSKVSKEQVDIGDSSAPVEAELPDRDSYEKFTDHVVGVDGQPIVVSREVKDAGVTKLTGQQVADIYKGNITTWQEVDSYDGPDKEIQALGRAEGSGTDTAFRLNLLGDPDAAMPGTDGRYGQNQQLQTAVANSDNAIAYIALAFVQPEGQVPPIALELDGTVYELGKNLGAKEYPLSRDLHCYTWDGTSKKESAFLRMLLSEYGQKNFVEPNNYFKLPPNRREEERAKLAEPTN